MDVIQAWGQTEMTTFLTEFWAWYYSYFNYFASGDGVAFAGWAGFEDGGHQVSDLVQKMYMPAAPQGTMVTFTEYPPAGYLAWCLHENCQDNGVEYHATGVTLGYEYDASVYYFVYYATTDAVDAQGALKPEIVAYQTQWFAWTVESAPRD